MADLGFWVNSIPVIPGVATLIYGALRREQVFRRNKIAKLKEQQASLPEGSITVQQGSLYRKEGLKLHGTVMIVSAGSPAAKRHLDVILAHSRAGLDDTIGSNLIFDCDSAIRLRVEQSVPEVYRDRTVFGTVKGYENGFGNLPPRMVEKNIVHWGVALRDAVEQTIKLHEERNSAKPAEVWLFISLGGHAFPGVFIAQELHKQLPTAQIIGVVNLPRKESQRQYFLDLKQDYNQAGVSGWIISDQMEKDPVTMDSVVADIFTAISAAAIYGDSSLRTNNVMTNLAGIEEKGLASYAYRYSDIVAHPYQSNPGKPPRYYVSQEQVISELRLLIGQIERGEGAISLDIPTGEQGRHTYDLALCALDPRDLLAVGDQIERSREVEDAQLEGHVRPHLHAQANHETAYVSWSHPIDPEHPRCRVGVIRLQAIRDAEKSLSEIVKVPSKRHRQKQFILSRNGHEEYDKF